MTNTDLFGTPEPSANRAAESATGTPQAAESAQPEQPSTNHGSAEPAGDGPDRANKRRRAPGLQGMVLAELQQLAGSLGITGTGRMRKGELIAAIRTAQGSDEQHGGENMHEQSETRQQQFETASSGSSPASGETGTGVDGGGVTASAEPSAQVPPERSAERPAERSSADQREQRTAQPSGQPHERSAEQGDQREPANRGDGSPGS
ncbi:MAG: Rho termination factor N-terminal domain-containing protein, partial [Actinomycetota bacterium]